MIEIFSLFILCLPEEGRSRCLRGKRRREPSHFQSDMTYYHFPLQVTCRCTNISFYFTLNIAIIEFFTRSLLTLLHCSDSHSVSPNLKLWFESRVKWFYTIFLGIETEICPRGSLGLKSDSLKKAGLFLDDMSFVHTVRFFSFTFSRTVDEFRCSSIATVHLRKNL